MRKRYFVIIALLTLAALFFMFFLAGEHGGLRSVMNLAVWEQKEITIVIDPGHEGI